MQERIPLPRSPAIGLILHTPKGRGVFAMAPILAGTVLETCPVLVLGQQDNAQHVAKTELFHYTYNWPVYSTPGDASSGLQRTAQAVVLGLGSMFNHSTADQNVGWTRDLDRLLVTYRALRDVCTGEELCISYGARLTFVDSDVAPQHVDEDSEARMLAGIFMG